MLTSQYNYLAVRPYSNTHTKFDYECKGFRIGARTSNFENFCFITEIHCTLMYIPLKPAILPASSYNNNAARPYSNTHTKFDYDRNGFRMDARTSNLENFYFLIETLCKSMNICLLLQNQLLCQQVAIITTQPGHIAIHIPTFIRIERGSE